MSKFIVKKRTTPQVYPPKSYAEEAFLNLDAEYDWYLADALDLHNCESTKEAQKILARFIMNQGKN